MWGRKILQAATNLSKKFTGQERTFGVKEALSKCRSSETCFYICSWQRLNATKVAWNKNLNVLAELFAKQCNAIAALRVRRAAQIFNLYSRLYDKQTFQHVVEKLGHRLLKNGKKRSLHFLFGASLFSWEKEKITDEEMASCGNEIHQLRSIDGHVTVPKALTTWESVIDRDRLQVYRRPIENTYLFEYKVCGTFSDISARSFYDVQVDLEYRKQWDKLVIELDTVERDAKSGCEVIHWVTHFPFPMYSRDYVYMRKCKVDQDKKLMVIVSHAVEHPYCPVSDTYVRVSTYCSNLVIRPHGGFDENGFDYILTYCDDPQASFPTAAYNWMASTGVPDFVNKLHTAAKNLQESPYRARHDQENSDEGAEFDENGRRKLLM